MKPSILPTCLAIILLTWSVALPASDPTSQEEAQVRKVLTNLMVAYRSSDLAALRKLIDPDFKLIENFDGGRPPLNGTSFLNDVAERFKNTTNYRFQLGDIVVEKLTDDKGFKLVASVHEKYIESGRFKLDKYVLTMNVRPADAHLLIYHLVYDG